MKTSESIAALAASLATAQGELKNVEKGKINPHFKSRYADIADGLDVVRPVFSKHGLSVVQATDYMPDTGVFVLVTRIIHKSGEWIESTYPLPTNGKPQDVGSALTYARRYALFSLAGVAGTDEDDDGNDAQNTTQARKPASRPAPPKVPVEPPFEADESATVCETMIATLDLIDVFADLRDWASNNAAIKARMTPVDQDRVTAAFTKAQKRVREATPA